MTQEKGANKNPKIQTEKHDRRKIKRKTPATTGNKGTKIKSTSAPDNIISPARQTNNGGKPHQKPNRACTFESTTSGDNERTNKNLNQAGEDAN